MDVAWTLQFLLPAPCFGGCIEYERPVQDENGQSTGEFYNLSDEEIKQQYENLRWEDERTKPSWDELLVAWPTAKVKMEEPLLIQSVIAEMDAVFDGLNVQARSMFYQIRAGVHEALLQGDFEAAGFIINSVSVDPSLESLKDQMLGILKQPTIKTAVIPTDFTTSEETNPTTDPSDWWTKLKTAIQNLFGGNNG